MRYGLIITSGVLLVWSLCLSGCTSDQKPASIPAGGATSSSHLLRFDQSPSFPEVIYENGETSQHFAILATKGEHDFFIIESGSIHDIRHTPLKVGGYSISYRRGGRRRSGEKDHTWHAHVEIERRHYLNLKARLLDLATHRTAENLALEFYRIPFEPYSPVRRQLLNLRRAVNRARKAAGYNLLPVEVIPLRRRIVRPFEIQVTFQSAESISRIAV